MLRQAPQIARTNCVIEFEGTPETLIRIPFEAACKRAKPADVTPHLLRHTAAVWMAEAGISMAKIAQYLGRSDNRITERVYARFAPEHLADAAGALEV